jgi:sirohydrochlorin cobaltochelatase
MTRALLLAGHGSAHDPLAGAPVRQNAERIRALGLFDAVHVAFWKEAPYLAGALERIRADDIFVVPMFLAEGWYTRRVVPRELGIERALTHRGGTRIHYRDPIGAHPAIARVVWRRARRSLAADGVDARAATLAIVGHGTRRVSGSGHTVERIARALRRRFADVTFGFLDQDPCIEHALEDLRARHTVVVPFLLAEGWHTRITIPERLGPARALADRDSRFLTTPPVGTHPAVTRIILDLARPAGMEMDGTVPSPVSTLPFPVPRSTDIVMGPTFAGDHRSG